jgi:hypothetical protein
MDYSKYKNSKPFPSRGMESATEMRREYDAEEGRLLQLFWSDLCEEYDISPEHPKYSLLSHLAWEHGHSAGLQEVEYYFGEFIELIL